MTIELEPGFPVVPSARTGEASRPPPRERSVRVRFPALRSMADATDAMAAISDAVASDAIRPGEAAELSRFVKASIRRSTLAGSFSGSWLLRQNSSDDTASRHRPPLSFAAALIKGDGTSVMEGGRMMAALSVRE